MISGQPFGCPLTFLNNRHLLRSPSAFETDTSRIREDRDLKYAAYNHRKS